MWISVYVFDLWAKHLSLYGAKKSLQDLHLPRIHKCDEKNSTKIFNAIQETVYKNLHLKSAHMNSSKYSSQNITTYNVLVLKTNKTTYGVNQCIRNVRLVSLKPVIIWRQNCCKICTCREFINVMKNVFNAIQNSYILCNFRFCCCHCYIFTCDFTPKTPVLRFRIPFGGGGLRDNVQWSS